MGGIVGEAWSITVEGCTNHGDVFFDVSRYSGTPKVGGIVGHSTHSNVKNCKNYGEVTKNIECQCWRYCGLCDCWSCVGGYCCGVCILVQVV